MSTIRVAACHVSPVFLDAKATAQKAVALIHAAARNGADLVVFPETFISAFPIWSTLRPPIENHALFKRMAEESVFADGDEINAIQAAARETQTFVSIGISEKVRYSCATLFNANLFIGRDGRILNHHRKLMPTFFEKLTWAHGDGHGLRVIETPFGKIGNLICGENTNPLARYSLMAQGEQLHISTWPAAWPTRLPESVTQGDQGSEDAQTPGQEGADRGRNYDNVAANRTRAAAHCFEAKCFGVLCSGYLNSSAIEIIASGSASAELIKSTLLKSPRGATMFLDPTGAAISGFVVDEKTGEHVTADYLQNEEGVLYSDLNLADCVEGKQFHDVVGGYQRHDIFSLTVNRVRQKPITFSDSVEGTMADVLDL